MGSTIKHTDLYWIRREINKYNTASIWTYIMDNLFTWLNATGTIVCWRELMVATCNWQNESWQTLCFFANLKCFQSESTHMQANIYIGLNFCQRLIIKNYFVSLTLNMRDLPWIACVCATSSRDIRFKMSYNSRTQFHLLRILFK